MIIITKQVNKHRFQAKYKNLWLYRKDVLALDMFLLLPSLYALKKCYCGKIALATKTTCEGGFFMLKIHSSFIYYSDERERFLTVGKTATLCVFSLQIAEHSRMAYFFSSFV